MRRELLVFALMACNNDPDGPHKDRQDPPPAETDLPPEGNCGAPNVPVPTTPGVDATAIEAEPFAQNALGRVVTVSLAEAAGAVLTCTLDAAPPVWRELVPLDASWRWVDEDPGADFVDASFDDSAWASDPAPFAREDECATDLAYDVLAPPDRMFFRTTFDVADPAAVRSLAASVRRDDGVVLWLNGVEIARDNVPPLVAASADDERRLFPYDLDPALLVAGPNTLAAEIHQYDGSTDAGFTLRVVAEVDEELPETHTLTADQPGTTHTFSLFGLLPDATYTCEARSDTCGGAVASTVVQTDPLPVPIRLATSYALDEPRSGAYTLFNHSRPCGEDRSNRLFIVDPEGRVRWYRELPIDAISSIDIEAKLLDDGTIFWGGGEEPEGKPQTVGLDGETRYSAAYPGVEQDVYHHDVERMPDGKIIGIVESTAGDGLGDTWGGFSLVEHDPATGEVTWRWDAQEAYDRGELPGPELGEYDPWHPNSLAVVDDAEGVGIYVSLFDMSEIIRIDRTTGLVSWRLGLGQEFTLVGGSEVWFDHLHSVDVFPGPNGDRLFLYDNGNSRGVSRALALELDVPAREARIAWEWTEPTWYEPNWGDFDQTGEGTMHVTMSHAWCLGGSLDHPGSFVEVDEATGDVVSRIDFLDSDDATYRSERIDGCAIFANDRFCAE